MKYALGYTIIDRAYRVEVTVAGFRFHSPLRYYTEAAARAAVTEVEVAIAKENGTSEA